MKKIKIVFLDRGTFPQEMALHKPQIPHDWEEYDSTPLDQVVERSLGAEVIVVNKVPIGRETIEKLPNLKLITVTATGTNNIDLQACAEHRIEVLNVINYGTDSVAEHCWCLILNLFRQFLPYRNSILNNQWPQSKNFSYFLEPVYELAGAQIAIIGPGVIGRRVGELATAFKMKVLFVGNPQSKKDKKETAADPKDGIEFTTLERALKTSDVITIHCPLTEKTRNLISFPEFEQMKKTAFLVNTSRGGIVDEAALAIALEENRIAGAAFDVLSQEPPALDHILHRLKNHPHFILTPHIAWVGRKSVNNLLNKALSNIDNFYRPKD